jgi:type IV secretion system protein VirB10
MIPSFNPSTGHPPAAQPGTLRPKKPRRLTKWPAVIAGCLMLAVVSIVIWVLLNSRNQQEEAASAPPAYQTPGSAVEIINRAPATAAIPAATAATLPPSPPPELTGAPVATPKAEPVDPDMMPMAVEARRAAWQTYYQILQAKKDSQRQAMIAALTEGSAVSEGAGGQPTGNGQQPNGQQHMAGGPVYPGMPPMPGGGIPGVNGYGGIQSPPQHRRDFFLEKEGEESDYSPYMVKAPISEYELKAGVTTIFGRMVSGLTSDSAGIIRAVVTKHVTDAATGSHILIPQGSTLVGTYDNAVAYGQRRIGVAWTRVIYPAPGRESLTLGRQPGMDAEGYSGFQDQTDNHYGQVFTNAILLSLFSAGVQLSQPQAVNGENIGPGQIVASSIGQQLGQLGQEFASRGLDIPPTNSVRQGYEFAIVLTKDIAFLNPWKPSTRPGQSKMMLVDAEQ